MALANFFDKTALAASEVLTGFDRTAFESAVAELSVGIAFDDTAARNTEGRVALELTVNLLARFYPRLALLPRGKAAPRLADCLARSARAINPNIELSEKDSVSAIISIGSKSVSSKVPVIYVGSDNWMTHISPERSVGCGKSGNPFGAAAAACLGAANVFRLLFSAQLGAGRELDRTRSLSLVDFRTDDPSAENPPLKEVRLGDTSLVGIGAIGNAVLWAFKRLPDLSGTLTLVDHETVDLSNLQRYVLSTQSDVGASKVELAKTTFNGAQLDVQAFKGTWSDYLDNKNHWAIERVAVAVDSARDRLVIQGSLPKTVLNAWTQPGDLGVSRHPQFGEQACLTCLYFPQGQTLNEDELIANAIGLPQEFELIRKLLYNGTPIGGELISRIATARGIDPAPLMRFENQPLRVFYSEAVCGGIMMALGATGTPQRTEVQVPMAFQSALAGILLGSEMVLHATGLRRTTLPTTTRIDLLKPLGTELSAPFAMTPRCICSDPDFLSVYATKYPRTECYHRKIASSRLAKRRAPRLTR